MSYERVNQGFKREVAYFYEWCIQVLQVDKDQVIRRASEELIQLLRYKTFPHEKFFLEDDLKHKNIQLQRGVDSYLLNDEMTFNLILFLVYYYELPGKFTPQTSVPSFESLLKQLPFFWFVLDEKVNKGGVSEEMIKENQGKHLLGEIHPDLEYDPEYRKIIQNPLYQDIFLNYYIKKHDQIERAIHESIQKDTKNDPATPGNVLLKCILNPPAKFFALLNLYEQYYCLRVPSKRDEIRSRMLFFKSVFELNNARLECTIPLQKIRSKLDHTFTHDEIKNLLQKYVLQKSGLPFATSKSSFKPTQFFSQFNDSLKVIGYLHSGVVRTGFCLIWRALLKYWEDLTAEREFYKTRGKLLENYCYEIIFQLGIECRKIYIRNTSKPESSQYQEMLQQTSEFPEPPISLEFDFSQTPQFQNKGYAEIDMACRISGDLLLIECKGTKVKAGEVPMFFNWIRRYEDQQKLLHTKSELLTHAMKIFRVLPSFLQNIQQVEILVVRSEGVYGFPDTIPYKELRTFLEKKRT